MTNVKCVAKIMVMMTNSITPNANVSYMKSSGLRSEKLSSYDNR